MNKPFPNKKTIQKQTRIVVLIFLVLVFYIWTTVPKHSAHPPATHGYATIDGMRIHYLDYGKGKEGLVFIHGWACDSSFWRFQAPAMQKYRLILLDLPGHGKSDKPEVAYTQDLLAESVNAVIQDAGIKSAVLVGHSMGFPVARQYIRNYPGIAKALVIVDGAFFRIPKDPQKKAAWGEKFEKFKDNFRGADFDKTVMEFMDSLFAEQTPLELRDEIKSKVSLTPQHVAIRVLEGMGDPEVWKEDALTIPTLAVYAKRPNLPSDNGLYLKQLFPNLEYYEWNGVGHFLMMEMPKKFNRLLTSFLDTKISSAQQ